MDKLIEKIFEMEKRDVFYGLYLFFFLALGTMKVNESFGVFLLAVDIFSLVAYVNINYWAEICKKDVEQEYKEIEQELNGNEEFQPLKNKTTNNTKKGIL
ncbi:hypothetical protein JAO10_09145 [Burkholderia contaminans]|uniref:hypothetical protein n=1 Tax=Burkholderia contaminans TaxID=488447 RepID=UPI0018DCA2F2|nr:hypothetical protein [Burkholderia contaminans]MBH9720497.1 hypothetical protein [Burkholderia contaminans]